jgi:hypothetical protein
MPDRRQALSNLGDQPGEHDVLFLTTYGGRGSTEPDVVPRASVGQGW